jgi:hypothetical protein
VPRRFRASGSLRHQPPATRRTSKADEASFLRQQNRHIRVEFNRKTDQKHQPTQ